MRTVSTVVAMLVLSGCAGMQQVKPNERFLQGAVGDRVFMEYEYESGAMCNAELRAMEPQNEIITARCAATSQITPTASRFEAFLPAQGNIIMKFVTMNYCKGVREKMLADERFRAATIGECK